MEDISFSPLRAFTDSSIAVELFEVDYDFPPMIFLFECAR